MQEHHVRQGQAIKRMIRCGMLVSIAGGKGIKSGTLEVVFSISWNNLDDVLNPDAELAVLVIAGLIRQDHPSLQPCNTTQLPIQSVPYYGGPSTELRARIR
jgi:hypothetical protein